MTPAAYAEINLAAVRHNLEKVRQHAPHSKIMAVVKANAYGHGLVRIANALGKADALAVARIDEGIRLRQAGIKQRIVVLQGFSHESELYHMVEFNLEAVVHQARQLDTLENVAAPERLTIWLKIDTGMNRLGFKPDQVGDAYGRLIRLSNVNQPVNLMTHLASADEPANPFTSQQIDHFNRIVQTYPGERCIANSAGILGWQNALSDWVRPGIMLYGISPFAGSIGMDWELQPVMNLHSRLIAVKKVNKGETVGYGNAWRCEHTTVLGVVAIGYGDGYPRYAQPGTPVLVNNARVPLIGRVSMDMITVDLATQSNAQPGDPVTLWGEVLPVEKIASHADTIPYTLVCGVTQRVQMLET